MSIDPRFDPAFQRGYDPDRDGRLRADTQDTTTPATTTPALTTPALTTQGAETQGADAAATEAEAPDSDRAAPARARPPEPRAASALAAPARTRDEQAEAPAPSWVAAAPAVDAAGYHPAELAPHPAEDPDAAADTAPAPQTRGERIVILVLVLGSGVLAIVGLIGVISLSTRPPLSLAAAATPQGATLQLVIELLSGPALAVGAVGLAAGLALVATARRRARPSGRP